MQILVLIAAVVIWWVNRTVLDWLDDRYHAQRRENDTHLPRIGTYYTIRTNRDGDFVTIQPITQEQAHWNGVLRAGVQVHKITEG